MRDGWVEATLGQISKCAGGCAFPDAFQGNKEGIPFIKVSDMNSQDNEKYIATSNNSVSGEVVNDLRLRIWDKGTVIFPKVGAALLTEKRRILTKKTIFDNNIMGLVPNERVLSEFLFLLLLQIRFSDHVQLGAVPSIKNSIVEAISVLLPSLDEQQRIVDLISSVDSYIEALQQQLASAKRSRNAVLHELLTAGGDDWVETTLGQEFEICKNGKNYRDGISTEGLPISRIQTIASGKIDLTKVGFGDFFLEDAEGFLLEEGDILFSHINSLPHVGKVAIVQHNHLPLIHGMNLLRMRFANSNDTNFMFYLMQHESMRDEIRSRAQVAVNQVSINISSIKTIKIVIPPLRTQKEIASLICAWDNLIEECENNLNSSRNLRVGLLSELLSGEHEIPASYDKVMGAA